MGLLDKPAQDEKQFKVCRVAARTVPGSGPSFSDDPMARSFEVRFVAFALFLPLMFVLLGLGKLYRTLGKVWSINLAALVVLAVVGAVLWRRKRAKEKKPERDVDEQLLRSEVVALLASGYLRPTDLVWERQAWATLAESMEFSEEAGLQQDRINRVERLKLAAFIVLGLGVAGVAIVAFANLGALFDWLQD
ncbi:MAG: hypothetical protein QM765_28280 [Myxococcales bacterium]